MLNAANSLPSSCYDGTDDSYKYYLGLSETSFKNIYRKYIHLLIMSNKKITELSQYVWSLKNGRKLQ